MVFTPPNVTSMTGFYTWANGQTSGIMGLLIAFASYIIMFLVFKGYWQTERAIIASSFTQIVVILLLSLLGLVSMQIILIPVLFLLIGVFMLDRES